MKIKDNLSIRKVGNNYMMVTDSDQGIDYTRIINLNETAYYLLQQVQSKDFTADEWVSLLTEKYNVTQAQAAKDVDALVGTLTTSGVLE